MKRSSTSPTILNSRHLCFKLRAKWPQAHSAGFEAPVALWNWAQFFLRTWRPRLAKIHHELLLFHRSIQPGTSPRFQELKPWCILMHQREGLTGCLQSNFSQYINSLCHSGKKRLWTCSEMRDILSKYHFSMGKMVINDNALVILG